MGTEDLFHKRKGRSTEQLRRRPMQRKPYDRVLIVCEGSKTEPFYFADLKDSYGLSTANVEICSNCGSNPISILQYGKKRYREESSKGNRFDRVYCVFDKDNHTEYRETISKIQGLKPINTYFAINSVPCFEYWLLVHFSPTTRPYNDLPGKSACNQVLAELRMHMPHYTKGKRGVFTELEKQLMQACRNAKQTLQAAENNDNDNPSTNVHMLIEFLQNIKNQT